MLSWLVSIPLTFITLLVRLSAIMIIIRCLPVWWCTTLIIFTTFLFTVLNMFFFSGSNFLLIFLRVILGLFSPLGYQTDKLLMIRSTKTRGSLLIGINYIITMTGLCLGVYTAISRHFLTMVEVPSLKNLNMRLGMSGKSFRMKTHTGVEYEVRKEWYGYILFHSTYQN